MKTYRELALAAANKDSRKMWHQHRIEKARLQELIIGSYDNYAGEQAELIRGYCLYLSSLDRKVKCVPRRKRG